MVFLTGHRGGTMPDYVEYTESESSPLNGVMDEEVLPVSNMDTESPEFGQPFGAAEQSGESDEESTSSVPGITTAAQGPPEAPPRAWYQEVLLEYRKQVASTQAFQMQSHLAAREDSATLQQHLTNISASVASISAAIQSMSADIHCIADSLCQMVRDSPTASGPLPGAPPGPPPGPAPAAEADVPPPRRSTRRGSEDIPRKPTSKRARR